jgi:hypothetical protein
MYALTGTSIPAAGTYTVSCSFSSFDGSQNSSAGGSMAFKAIKDQAKEATNVAGGSSGNLSSSVTTLTKKALLVTGYGSQNTPGSTSTTGDTRAFNSVPSTAEQSECDGFYRTVTTPGSATVTMSSSNPEDQAMVIASFAIQPSGGGFFGLM